MPDKEKLHPSFQKLWDKAGSGYYYFPTPIGLGTIFYMSSRSVDVYNPRINFSEERTSREHWDFYDALRAVETGVVNKLAVDIQFVAWEEDGRVIERESVGKVSQAEGV